jgi:hypothetical protein
MIRHVSFVLLAFLPHSPKGCHSGEVGKKKGRGENMKKMSGKGNLSKATKLALGSCPYFTKLIHLSISSLPVNGFPELTDR